jgi:flagellar biosynthesis protein FlhB
VIAGEGEDAGSAAAAPAAVAAPVAAAAPAAVAAACVAAARYAAARLRFERRIRMTPQECADEAKSLQADPKIRLLHQQRSRQPAPAGARG